MQNIRIDDKTTGRGRLKKKIKKSVALYGINLADLYSKTRERVREGAQKEKRVPI